MLERCEAPILTRKIVAVAFGAHAWLSQSYSCCAHLQMQRHENKMTTKTSFIEIMRLWRQDRESADFIYYIYFWYLLCIQWIQRITAKRILVYLSNDQHLICESLVSLSYTDRAKDNTIITDVMNIWQFWKVWQIVWGNFNYASSANQCQRMLTETCCRLIWNSLHLKFSILIKLLWLHVCYFINRRTLKFMQHTKNFNEISSNENWKELLSKKHNV